MKIDYPICQDYVQKWGLWEASREFVQNAMDSGDYDVIYDSTGMSIRSDVDIPRSCLLLGKSVKAEGSIGKFGEGLKLAMLVLARMERKCVVRTFNEKWTANFVDVDGFDEEILRITVEECSHSNFVNVFIPMTLEEYEEISNNILKDRSPHILEGYSPGTIFVGGLYVCKLKDFAHAYNLSPTVVTLNRDRDIPSMFDLQVAASNLLPKERLLELAIVGSGEISQYASSGHSLYRAWDKSYSGIIPVGVSEQDQEISDKNIKIVPDWLAQTIRRVGNIFLTIVSGLSVIERLIKWLDKWGSSLPQPALEELKSIIKVMEKDARL